MIWVLFLAAMTPTYELTVDSNLVVVEARRIGAQNYLPLKSVVNALDVTYVFDAQTQRHTLSANGHSVVLIGDVNVIRSDSISLPVMGSRVAGRPYSP